MGDRKILGQAIKDSLELARVYGSLMDAVHVFNHFSSFFRCKLIEKTAYTWVYTHPFTQE